MRKLIILVSVLLLAGCSTVPVPEFMANFNPQNYQGCTVTVYEKEGVILQHWDCKDKATVGASVEMSEGAITVTYNASDVVGSEAARIRAEVEKAFAEAGVQVAPAIIDGIVNTVLGL